MAKILFVHGMRMQHHNGNALHARWYQALLRGLRETAWGKANPGRLPTKTDVELAHWGDLFRPTGAPEPTDITKGPGIADLRAAYYAFLRGLVRAADRMSFWDQDGLPRGPVAMLVNRLVYQSAVYMNNGPVPNSDPNENEGAFFQIQARFESKLKTADTRIVIAHSLGSVIAYEGLCRNPHNVDTFITVGSPIATPYLILEPLRERLHRLLNHPPHLTPPWPGVRQWLNFCAPADVWSAPVKRIGSIFGGRHQDTKAKIRDIEVVHGNPHDFVRTHKLTTYLKHSEIHNAIADVLEAPPTVGQRGIAARN